MRNGVNTVEVNFRRRMSASRPREERRHAVSKAKRIQLTVQLVSLEVLTLDTGGRYKEKQHCCEFYSFDESVRGRKLIRRNDFDSTLSLSRMVETPCIHSIQGGHGATWSLYIASICEVVQEGWRQWYARGKVDYIRYSCA